MAQTATLTQNYSDGVFKTANTVVHNLAKANPDRVAIRQKRYGIWNEYSWADVDRLTRELAAALIEMGVKRGSKVGILSENRCEWVLAQFAIQAAGATVVGMYPTSPSFEIHHLVDASDTEFLFIEDQEQFDKIVELEGKTPRLKKLMVFDPKGLHDEEFLGLQSFSDLAEIGRSAIEQHAKEIEARITDTKAEDTALMVFTSGSTGAPKAAKISHGNYFAAGKLIDNFFGGHVLQGSNILSYLPLCHIAEQDMTVVNALAANHIMNFGESLRTITLDLRDAAPDLFFGVPRIWEKMQAGLMVHIKTAHPIQTWISEMALRSAERLSHTPRSKWTIWQRAVNQFWDVLVYRHLRSFLGLGRVKIAITAAAPISLDLLTFFRGIGVNICEIWGMTETTGAACMQPDWGESDGRVGFFPEGVEAKLADDGELLVKGGIVFKGYYRNPEATSSTLVDGWLHTGDIAASHPDGSFSIVDRKKDVMITAAGKNLTPSLIENTMKASPYIKECIVIADRRPYPVGLVQIDFETMRVWAEKAGITYTTFRSLAENPAVVRLINDEVHRLNERLARVEQIKKVRLLTKELDHDDGEVTATLKVRRAKINETYAEVIESLYEEQAVSA
ncbi:AMP-dependent synthetase/ligase [Maritalea porphyrae]|uniref:Long-chain-fatty-acid--CoA ligase n=1 Tax=Maritalea porphyrae TaxID=880732 RepID=A0ABQ5UTH9_9HYPH|nr:long-chain fatty acid--CoA ligase [Maritalea porphyrae]GLQ18421.1 long-chain-fatty-acid--CoA ligase [Maritalea porphyrae]